MIVALAHGIRQVRAQTHMRPLADALESRGVATCYASYGYVFIPTTNRQAVDAVTDAVGDGADVAAYSNGAWAAWQAANEGVPIRRLYLLSPTLRRDTPWPGQLARVHIWYDPTDMATCMGRLWRQATRVLPWRWRNPHGWGAMGTYGPSDSDPRVTSSPYLARVGHSWWKHPEVVRGVARVIAEF